MSPTEEKIKAVKEWQRPNDVTDVRSFLGFANFYRRYIHKFAEIASPLTQLTKANDPGVWGPLQGKAFIDLKSALCQAPLLIYPDPQLQYVVVTDASAVAVGGTLMQDQGDGLRPIAFMSRTLSPAERRYSPYERELAAMAFCLVKWRHYLEGCPGGVRILTDHKTLTSLNDTGGIIEGTITLDTSGVFPKYKPHHSVYPWQSQCGGRRPVEE